MAASKTTIQQWRADLVEVSRDVQEAIKQFFIEMGMQRAAKRDRMVYQALNHNARFWAVASHSMTVGVYMALRRIMDDGTDASSMKQVIQFVMQSPEQFDDRLRLALKRRELRDDGANIKRERQRLVAAMKRIDRTFRKMDREWKTKYHAIATFRFAHSIPSKLRSRAFENTDIRWVDRTLCKLQALVDEMENLERNGHVPTPSRSHVTHLRAESLQAAYVEMQRLKASYVSLLPEMRVGRRRGIRQR